MSRRQWARGAYRLSRAIGNTRPLSLAIAWQVYKLGPEVMRLIELGQYEAATVEAEPHLFIEQGYIDRQREEAWLQ